MEIWDEVYCILAGEREGPSVAPWIMEAYGSSDAYETAHQKLMEARNKLCRRFHLHEEDEVLEEIMNAVLQIEKDISRRGFSRALNMEEEKLTDPIKTSLHREVFAVIV